jgi:hypothetical protein
MRRTLKAQNQRRDMLAKERVLLLNVVCIVTIASLVTGCCCLTPEYISEMIETDMSEGKGTTAPLPTPEFGGPVLAEPTPEEATSEPVEVVSQTELTREEFFQVVQEDEEFADLYSLATDWGYTAQGPAGRMTFSDGSRVVGIDLLSSEGEIVGALHFDTAARSVSLLARAEPERQTLILYNREGRTELTTVDGVTVDIKTFEATENPVSEGRRPPGLAQPVGQGSCTGGVWSDFNHCALNIVQFAGGAAVVTACAAGVLACTLTTVGFWGCVAALLPGCPFVFACAIAPGYMWVDDPPTYEAMLPVELPSPSRSCANYNGLPGMATIPAYSIQLHIDDDRPPRPATPQEVLVSGVAYGIGEAEVATLRIKDCAGHEVVAEVKPVVLQPSEFFQACNVLPQCSTVSCECVEAGGVAQCRPAQGPGPEVSPTWTPQLNSCIPCRPGHDEDCGEPWLCCTDLGCCDACGG